MIKAEKVILIVAGLSVVFFLVSMLLPSPKEGSVLQMLMLIPVFPIIIGIMILVRHRSDMTIPPILRVIGLAFFLLWILSFFVDTPFRR